MKKLKPAQSNTFLQIVVTAWVFVLTLTTLNLFGLVPYYIDGTPSKAVAEAASKRDALQKEAEEQEALLAKIAKEQELEAARKPILPTRLVIPILGTDLKISNPETTDLKELDNELLTSIVRYPGSGSLGKDGNMLIFGHSTGYRTVRNKMFKAFNGLKTLEKGNYIKLIRGKKEYVYKVTTVEHEEASNVTIEFTTDPGVQQLTLTTCDSFGKKSDRFIITAEFDGVFDVEESDSDSK